MRRPVCLILGARWPLYVSEIKAALNACAGISPKDDHESEDDFKDRLRQLCGLFVCFHGEQVCFFLRTAQEFLFAKYQAGYSVLVSQSQVNTRWESPIHVQHVNVEWARASVQYLYMLSRDGSCDGDEDSTWKDTPLYRRAGWLWDMCYRFSRGSIDDDQAFLTSALWICDPHKDGLSRYFYHGYNDWRSRLSELRPLQDAMSL